MFTDMKKWREIRRRVLVEKESQRSILREYGMHYQPLQKILTHSEPLAHRPGEAQVDFGFAKIDWNGERQKVALFVMSLPYSDAFFICAFPRECTEAFQLGHCLAFEFFGAVPHRISYDNSKVAVSKVVGARRRDLTEGFLRLQSHFLYDEHFCLVRRANEKGHVESLVG